jgi:two-component system, chemotaxis family, response regulator Rcp1
VEKRPHILIVEDNKPDVFLIREAIADAQVRADLQVVPDGEKAIRLFTELDRNEATPRPDLVILDISLPKKHGGEVLQQMRTTRRCAAVLVVVVTSSDSEQDRRQMANLGANEYFQKPSEYREFMRLGEVVRKLLEKEA